MTKRNLSGNIKEDEKEAFDLICERTGVDEAQAKGVGFFNRLIKLCSVCNLKLILDYENNRFTVEGVPGPREVKYSPEELDELSKSDADSQETEEEEELDDVDDNEIDEEDPFAM